MLVQAVENLPRSCRHLHESDRNIETGNRATAESGGRFTGVSHELHRNLGPPLLWEGKFGDRPEGHIAPRIFKQTATDARTKTWALRSCSSPRERSWSTPQPDSQTTKHIAASRNAESRYKVCQKWPIQPQTTHLLQRCLRSGCGFVGGPTFCSFDWVKNPSQVTKQKPPCQSPSSNQISA